MFKGIFRIVIKIFDRILGKRKKRAYFIRK